MREEERVGEAQKRGERQRHTGTDTHTEKEERKDGKI
jgi:hypothetical protein